MQFVNDDASSKGDDEQCEGDYLVEIDDSDVHSRFGVPVAKLVGHGAAL